jgi:hypothetical protein
MNGSSHPNLSVVPHFTTLQKFFSRIKTLHLRYAFRSGKKFSIKIRL